MRDESPVLCFFIDPRLLLLSQTSTISNQVQKFIANKIQMIGILISIMKIAGMNMSICYTDDWKEIILVQLKITFNLDALHNFSGTLLQVL